MSQPALNPKLSVSVAASAGSGKTWLLSARIVRLLLDGAGHERLLALTFTRKAATEMGQRVLQRLRELALADEATLDAKLREIEADPTPALRERARQLYREVALSPWPLRASTIHAFCQELVTRFPQVTGIPPGFELAEEEGALLREAWESVQPDLLRKGAATDALQTLISEGYSEFGLTTLVLGFLARRTEWRSYAAGRDDALRDLQADLEMQLHIRLGDSPWLALQHPEFETALSQFLKDLHTAGDVRSVKFSQLEPALMCEGEARYQILRSGLFSASSGEPYAFNPSKAAQAKLGNALPRLLDHHQQLTQTLKQVHAILAAQTTLRRTLAGITLGLRALKAFEDLLRQRRILPFAELEWSAVQLLRDPEAGQWVQYKLDARIDHLLLDEFQDTSPSQWQLLRPLLAEMASDPARGRSAFLVGDVKQSIYGFRRAEPGLMPVAADWLAQHLGGTAQSLNASHRSSPVVLEFVNALFQQTGAAGLMRDFPTHETRKTSLWGRVEWTPLVQPPEKPERDADAELRDPLTTPRPDPENERALLEGRQIAARIQALVQAGPAVGRDAHRLGHDDIMILLRKRTHMQALERALTEAGIPFIGAARGTLLETVEAQDLVALLRWLDAPWRNLDLAQVLRSPLFGVSEDELSALALACPQDSPWFSVLAQMETPRLREAADCLPRWLALARQLPVHDLLDRLVAERNLAARYEQALPPAQAARARANLSRLLQQALESDRGRSPSIARFLHTLEQVDDREAPSEAPPPAQSGAVRILTIHAAKGLEAAAVFVAQCGGGDKPPGSGWWVDWPAGTDQPRALLLAGSQDERDTYSSALIAAQADREARESLNLLYVAATRAQHFLHFSGFALKKNSSGMNWHELAGAAMDALNARSEDGLRSTGLTQWPLAVALPSAPKAELSDERLRQPLSLALKTAAPADEPDAATVRRGLGIHALLQGLSEGRTAAALRTRLGRVEETEFSEWLAEAEAVIQAPALRHFFDPSTVRRAWNEVPVSTAEGERVLDRLVDDGETLWILDYKTQRDATDASLLQRYCRQLQSYLAAARQLWPQRHVRVGLVVTAQARWLPLES